MLLNSVSIVERYNEINIEIVDECFLHVYKLDLMQAFPDKLDSIERERKEVAEIGFSRSYQSGITA